MRLRSAIAVAAVLAGCSGNTALPAGAPDLTIARDLAVAPDLSIPPVIADMAIVDDPDASGIACGNMTCAPGLVCCLNVRNGMPGATCAASCDSDGGAVAVQCDGPESCPGGKPCCAQLMGASVPKAIACSGNAGDCVPDFNMQTFMGQTRLCHMSADCTRDAAGATLPDCCAANYGGNKFQICFNQNYAALIALLTKGAVTFVCQ